MKAIFITGIPASGKSYLAERLARELGGIHVELDDFREDLVKNEKYKKWVNFYLDQDEKDYYTNASPEAQWNNLVQQSENIWHGILEKINSYRTEVKPVIFECVNILPHLAKKDLDFEGIVLLGPSLVEILERNKKDPRWGSTEELQKMETESFWNIERPMYKKEAEKCGYKTFEDNEEAFGYARGLLK